MSGEAHHNTWTVADAIPARAVVGVAAGTLIGQRFTNNLVAIAFLALPAGSILYVVIELLAVGRRIATKEITTWGLLLGLLLGFATDALITTAGA